MSKVEVSNTWSIGFRVVIAAVILLLLVTALMSYSAADVRAVCATHQGVQQVSDETWTSGPDKAVVVCRDGYAGSVS